jgi:hypothetical protein
MHNGSAAIAAAAAAGVDLYKDGPYPKGKITQDVAVVVIVAAAAAVAAVVVVVVATDDDAVATTAVVVVDDDVGVVGRLKSVYVHEHQKLNLSRRGYVVVSV